MDTRQVILNAIHYLETEGWQQGQNFADLETSSGPACIIGALMRGAGAHRPLPESRDPAYGNYIDALRRVEGVYWQIQGDGPSAVYHWNDEDGRTKDEVLDLLERAVNDSPE